MNGAEAERQVAAHRWRPAVAKVLRLTLSVGCAITVASMMFLTFADVVGRYVFNSPILGAYEITEVLMGLMIFGALPLVSKKRGHITVDFLTPALPHRLRNIQSAFLELVCSAVAVVLGWRAWLYGQRLVEAGERTLELRLSMGVITYTISILLFMTALAFIANAWSSLRYAKRSEKSE